MLRKLLIFYLLLIAGTALSDDLLIKINHNDLKKVPESFMDRCEFRFQGQSFVIAQVSEDVLSEAHTYFSVIEKIPSDAVYYMVRSGRDYSALSEIGDIILQFSDSVLLRTSPAYEPVLISLGLPLMPLPQSIKLNLYEESHFEKRLSPSDLKARSDIITEIINSISEDNLRKVVSDLQENKSLRSPYNPYKSRYCLRVKDTDDPSDEACDNAAEYIFNKFEEYGLDVEYDIFPHEVLTQGHYSMRNVIATLHGKGSNSQRMFIISAHYDSIATKTNNWLLEWKKLPAPGANDNASGAAAVLETARILSQYDFDSTIKFVVFSGEELGLHGSKHYARMAVENGYEIAGVLNLDMIGYDPDIQDYDIITNQSSEWLAEMLISTQKRYNIGPLLLKKIVNADMVYSDHASFWQNGYNAILGIENSSFESPEFYPFMHTDQDTIDKLNFGMAAKMVQIAIGTLASIADPISNIPYPDLSVADLLLSNEQPIRGQEFQVTAHVRNIGEVDADGVVIQLWLEEPIAKLTLVREQVADITVNGSVEISAPVKLAEWGDYKILVKVNPDFRIFETDGRNNIAIRPIHIGSTSLYLGKLAVYPNPMNSSEKVNIAYALSKDVSTTLSIYSSIGKLIYQKHFANGEPGGKFGYNKGADWDGTNFAGEKVASGVYFCRITAKDENGATQTASSKIFVK